MSNGFKDKEGKFHPITPYKGVRKSRDQKLKTQGVRLKRNVVTGKVTPTEELRKELRETVPDLMVEDEIKRIQKEQEIEYRIPDRFRKYIDLSDVIEIEQMSR